MFGVLVALISILISIYALWVSILIPVLKRGKCGSPIPPRK
jgi:hypothetical protein